MKDPIVEEVRRIRKEIERENHSDWDELEKYLCDKQDKRPKPPVTYSPKKLPDRSVT